MKKILLLTLLIVTTLFADFCGLHIKAQAIVLKAEIETSTTAEPYSVAPADYVQQARLTVTPPSGFGNGPVAVSGNTAVIFSGVGFYVYVRDGNAWSQQALLVPSDGASVPSLFPSVAIEGDRIVIGGSGATINSKSIKGRPMSLPETAQPGQSSNA